MRGRNPDNPSDRTAGIPTEQRIEIGGGISNCITTVAKDSMILGKVKTMKRENKAFTYVEDKEDGYTTKKGDAESNYSVAAIAKVNEDEEQWGHSEEEEEPVEEISTEKTVEDYLYTAADGSQYGIFKLSPRECGRLMGVADADIDKMLAVNSNSQCYKQYGNSIVVPVLCGIFSQLNIKGIKPWNERTDEERKAWINPDNLYAEREEA